MYKDRYAITFDIRDCPRTAGFEMMGWDIVDTGNIWKATFDSYHEAQRAMAAISQPAVRDYTIEKGSLLVAKSNRWLFALITIQVLLISCLPGLFEALSSTLPWLLMWDGLPKHLIMVAAVLAAGHGCYRSIRRGLVYDRHRNEVMRCLRNLHIQEWTLKRSVRNDATIFTCRNNTYYFSFTVMNGTDTIERIENGGLFDKLTDPRTMATMLWQEFKRLPPKES